MSFSFSENSLRLCFAVKRPNVAFLKELFRRDDLTKIHCYNDSREYSNLNFKLD